MLGNARHKSPVRRILLASQLVIQAGSTAKGGDVFVLDRGKSIRVADLRVA